MVEIINKDFVGVELQASFRRSHSRGRISGRHFSRGHFSKILPRWRNGAQMGKKLLAVGFLGEPIGLFVDNMENRI